MGDENKNMVLEQFFIVHPVVPPPPEPDEPHLCLNIETQTQLVLNSPTTKGDDEHPEGDDEHPDSSPANCSIQI